VLACQARSIVSGHSPLSRQMAFSSIVSSNAETFHQFHQLFIIFTSIKIDSTYIQVITTPTIHIYRANHWNGYACVVSCGWVAAQTRPIITCSDRVKSLDHGPDNEPRAAMYKKLDKKLYSSTFQTFHFMSWSDFEDSFASEGWFCYSDGGFVFFFFKLFWLKL